MTYRTILTYADGSPEAAARLKIAAALAARSGAILDGVFVTPPLFPVAPAAADGLGFIPPSTWDALLESHETVVAEAERRARRMFEDAVADEGPRAEWSAVEETTPLGFIAQARCSDLVVFPKSGMANPRLPAMDLAQESAAPLVLVPRSPAASAPGRKVLVAWNGSREAASALRGAWPILEAADDVHVLMVEPPPEAEAFLARHLKRHGVSAQIHIDSMADAQAGEIIRRTAEDLAADLVVLGLYGHSRLRELVLGGASRTMLSQESFVLLVAR